MSGHYENIRFVPVDFRGMNYHLREFLTQMEHVTLASNICRMTFKGLDTLVEWRNRIAKWFLTECEEEYLCCFDDDAIPLPDTLKMLDSPADVVGCNFFAKTGHLGHGQDGAFSMAAYKVSRRALGAMEIPLYKFVYNEDHTAAEMCECLWFCQQARKAGFHPVKAGSVAHAITVGLVAGKDVDSCRMKFLQDIPLVKLGDSDGDRPMDGPD